MGVSTGTEKKREGRRGKLAVVYRVLVTCDRCGGFVSETTGSTRESALDLVRKNTGCQITKEHEKVKCLKCQEAKVRKPAWARK